MNPSVIFIDLDITMLEGNFDELWQAARLALLRRWQSRVTATPDAFLSRWADIENAYYEACADGGISHAEYGKRQVHDVLAAEGVEMSAEDSEAEWKAVAEDYLSGVRVYSDVPPALEMLAGYRLVVLTNGLPEWQKQKVAASGLERHFDRVLTWAETGCPKPDPLAFQKACILVGCQPDEAVNIGDSLEVDVRGAREAGLRAVWVNRAGDTQEEENQASDLTEAARIIRGW